MNKSDWKQHRMKQLISIFLISILCSSCSIYQQISDSYFSSRVVSETNCNELKTYEYNGFYEPSENGKEFEKINDNYFEKLSFENKPILSFVEIKSVSKSFDNLGHKVIQMTLTDAGREIFKVYTANNVGNKIGMIFRDKLISAPLINSEIPGGKVQIPSGNDVDIDNLYVYMLKAIECNNRNK